MANAAKSNKKPRTAITPTRAEDFPQWYQNVIKAADMAENSAVRGCMVIKPYGYAIWENMQKHFDKMIKREGVQNAYFPLLIPLSYIAKEAEHIDGFAKECAVVTHHRLEAGEDGGLVPAGELAEPMIIRPTSETIIGESFSKWVQSYRDLPMKINQWANVMRWEMRTRLFLRTSEFLWQEGHNVFETAQQASDDARRMLDVYVEFMENYLAIPALPGVKTPDERFPGAVETYSMEAIMQDGKALQAGTSHDLGQTFAKSSNITFQNRDGEDATAYTTSWGISTRLIGGLIMTHADDDGLIVPPKVAPYPVVIIPIVHKGADQSEIVAFCNGIKDQLFELDITVKVDDSENKTPDKLWGAIKHGVPIRVEVGGREMEADQVTYTRRDLGRESKKTVTVAEFVQNIQSDLEAMQRDMLDRARERTIEMIHDVSDLAELKEFFVKENTGLVRIDLSKIDTPEFEAICSEFSLTPRCIPFEDNGLKVFVGKAY